MKIVDANSDRTNSTRKKLVKASTELFLLKGFEATTVEEISARAGVSTRTFFRHFPTKEDAVFHDRPRRLDLFRSIMEAAPADFPPMETLKVAVVEVGKFYDSNRDNLAAEYTIVSGTPSLVAENYAAYFRMETVLTRCLRRFKGGPGLSARQAAMLSAAFLGGYKALIWDWVAMGCTDSMQMKSGELHEFVDRLTYAFGLTEKGAGNRTGAEGKSSRRDQSAR